MKFKEIINNYKNYKKSYSKNTKLKKIFYKINTLNKFVLKIMTGFLGSLVLFSPLIFLLLNTFSFGILLSSFLSFVIVISSFLSSFLFLEHFSEKNIKKNKIHENLIDLFKQRTFSNNKENKKLNNIFHKYINNENIKKEITNLNIIENNIKAKYEKEYDKNRKNKETTFSDIFVDHNHEKYKYVSEKKITFKDFIIFIFEEISIEDLKNIKDEKIEEILSDLNMEDKIELTSLIKNRLIHNNEKERKINENLKSIKEDKNIKKISIGIKNEIN